MPLQHSDVARYKNLGRPVVMVGNNLPSPGWDRVNLSVKYLGPLVPKIPASLQHSSSLMQMLSTSRKAASVKVGHPPIYGNQVGIWRGGVAWRRVAAAAPRNAAAATTPTEMSSPGST